MRFITSHCRNIGTTYKCTSSTKLIHHDHVTCSIVSRIHKLITDGIIFGKG